MEASRFVGRVGGLAVALGVGAAWFAGAVASADSGANTSSSASPTRGRVSEASTPRAASASRPVRQNRAGSAAALDRAVQQTVTARTATPAAAVSLPVSAPVTSQPRAAAATQNSSPVTSAATAQVTTSGSLAVAPTVAWGGTFRGTAYPGILVGTLGATSSLPLTYTLLSDPSLGGKIASVNSKAPSDTIFSSAGEFFYLPYATALTTPGTNETFKVLVAEQTPFDTFLQGIPVVGLVVTPVLTLLHQLPLISTVLAPLIGAASVVTFDVNANTAAAGRPTAFTVKVPSFDGLLISTNYFPATNVALGPSGTTAPTIFSGPGLGAPGSTDASNPYGQLNLLPGSLNPTPSPEQFGSLTPGIPVLRDGAWTSPDGGPSYTASTGFNVVTWDPRGEFASRDRSLPGLQIDSPFFEARDVSALITWLTTAANPARTQIATVDGDPRIGMVGGSYGGGIQWTTAGVDPRVDAIIPEISWNSLISSLYPNENQFKTGFGTILLLALMTTFAQINPQIYAGVATGILTGWLSDRSRATLSSAGPSSLVGVIDRPTLIVQGMQDVLFELDESVANAQTLVGNGVTTNMVWFCGGHGTCTDPLNPHQDDRGLVDNLRWLDQYVAGNAGVATGIPKFQWYDQLGAYYTSTKMPFEPGFNLPTPYTATGSGGFLGIVPIIGGSGPGGVQGVSPVLTIGNASKAWNAINTTVTPPVGSQIVGAPTLTFSYTGLGTTRTVYAQLVDDKTGEVLGNLVTPIPVVMDGTKRTVSIPMANIGYTTPTGGTLTLQITSSASNFENFLSFGAITISDITLNLPIRDQAV